MAAFLLMETLMIGVFAAQDLFLFYIFFEAGLIPMYLIIGIWGGARRIYASYKFFLYTLLGSVLMLVAMLWMVRQAGTTDIPTLMNHDFPVQAQTWLWLAFFASFAVKMPMWPVHTWLPDAHVEAPTAGSVILAGVLLKMGGYGFIRFSLPMFPEASAQLIWIVMGLSMVAIVYTSLVALVQQDMKKLIAYSSVAHMAFVTFGLFAFNRQGIEGSLLVMLSHGLVSGALFLCVGVIYDRLHTREISRYGGLANNMPGLCRAVPAVHHGLRWPARHVRLRRRVPGDDGHLSASTAGPLLSPSTGIITRRRLHALPLPPAWPTARPSKPDAAAMPDLSKRELALLVPIALPWCCGWAFIRKASWRPMRRDVGTLLDAARNAAMPAGDARLLASAVPHPYNCMPRTARHADAKRSRSILTLPELILSVGSRSLS